MILEYPYSRRPRCSEVLQGWLLLSPFLLVVIFFVTALPMARSTFAGTGAHLGAKLVKYAAKPNFFDYEEDAPKGSSQSSKKND